MSRVLNEAEACLADELFSLTDVVNTAARVVIAKKLAFTGSQNDLPRIGRKAPWGKLEISAARNLSNPCNVCALRTGRP